MKYDKQKLIECVSEALCNATKPPYCSFSVRGVKQCEKCDLMNLVNDDRLFIKELQKIVIDLI